MTVTTPTLPHTRRAAAPQSRRMPADPHGRAERVARGSLIIDRQVVAKIAGQAASEVAAAGGRSGGFLGIGAHTDLSARPKVDVELFGRSATIAMDVAVVYPSSVRQSTARVRERVISRLSELAGVTVTRVDINVTALQRADAGTRNQGLL